MLIGKISPTAVYSKQNSPFSVENITCDYISAIARPYELGASNVSFQVNFGNAVLGTDGVTVIGFNKVFDNYLNLTSAHLSSWGTDDSSMLTIISNALGTTISGIVNI